MRSRVTVVVEYFDESTFEEVKQTYLFPDVYGFLVETQNNHMMYRNSLEFAFKGEACVPKDGSHYAHVTTEKIAAEVGR